MVKRQPTRPHLYTHKGQTLSNKKANKNKQSHLTDLSPYYHMEGENNRMAPMRSHAQQCTVILLSHGRENNRTVPIRSHVQQCTVILLSHGKREQ